MSEIGQNFADTLLEAIDIIASERVNSISFDKTIRCTIVNTKNAAKGEYTVTDGTTQFLAYSDKPDYTNNTPVNVLIPNGDYSTGTKTILSKFVSGNDNIYYDFETPFDRFLDMTGNLLIEEEREFSLAANSKVTESSWELPFSITNSNEISTELTGYEVLGIRADFKTFLSKEDLISGDYGVCVAISGSMKSNPNDIVSRRYYLSSEVDMYGDPYNYMTYFKQEQIFNISDFKTITNVKIWFYEGDDFTNGNKEIINPELDNDNNEIKNIYMVNPYIAFGFLLDKYEPETILLYTVNEKESGITLSQDYSRIYEGVIASDFESIESLNLTNKKKILAKWIHEVEEYGQKKLRAINVESLLPRLGEEENSPIDAKVHWFLADENATDENSLGGIGWTEMMPFPVNNVDSVNWFNTANLSDLRDEEITPIMTQEQKDIINQRNADRKTRRDEAAKKLINNVSINNIGFYTITVGNESSNNRQHKNYLQFPRFIGEHPLEPYKNFGTYFVPNILKPIQKIKIIIEHSIKENLDEYTYENCTQAGYVHKILSSTSMTEQGKVENLKVWFENNKNGGFAQQAVKNIQRTWNADWDVTNPEDRKSMITYFNSLLIEIVNLFLKNQEGAMINYYSSNELEFTRIADSSESELIEGLQIVVDENESKGVFNCYEETGEIMASSYATKLRPMYAYYEPAGSETSNEVFIASTLRWTFPITNSLIQPPVEKKEIPEAGAEFYTEVPFDLIKSPSLTIKKCDFVSKGINNSNVKTNFLAGTAKYYVKLNDSLITVNEEAGEYILLDDGSYQYYDEKNSSHQNKTRYNSPYELVTQFDSTVEYFTKEESYDPRIEFYYFEVTDDGTGEGIWHSINEPGRNHIFDISTVKYYIKSTFKEYVDNDNNSVRFIYYENVPCHKKCHLEQTFRIKNYYTRSAASNKIKCNITIPAIPNIKEKEREIIFQGPSTNGTNYSFSFLSNKIALPVNAGNNSNLKLTPIVYNYNGEKVPVDWSKFSYGWYSANDKDWKNLKEILKDNYDSCFTDNIDFKVDYKVSDDETYTFDLSDVKIDNLNNLINRFNSATGKDGKPIKNYPFMVNINAETDEPSFADGVSFRAEFIDEEKLVDPTASNQKITTFRYFNHNGSMTNASEKTFLRQLASALEQVWLLNIKISKQLENPDLVSPDAGVKKALIDDIANDWIKRRKYLSFLSMVCHNHNSFYEPTSTDNSRVFYFQKISKTKAAELINKNKTNLVRLFDFNLSLDKNNNVDANVLTSDVLKMRTLQSAEAKDLSSLSNVTFYKLVSVLVNNDDKEEEDYTSNPPYANKNIQYPQASISISEVDDEDAEGNPVPGDRSLLLSIPNSSANVLDFEHYILRAELKNCVEYAPNRTTSLVAYYPICVMDNRYHIAHYDGCTSICYDSYGTNPAYYKQSYKIYNENNEDIVREDEVGETGIKRQYWQIDLGSDCEYNGKTSYPTLSNVDYTVQPPSMFLDNNGIQISATCYRYNSSEKKWIAIFTCPIRMYQQAFSMALINSWDGSWTVDENSGVALGTMFGAGRKNGYNQFEGVLMGDVHTGAGDRATDVGIYGYNEGVQSFGFRTNGTAFLGKSGSGRILFDGNKGTIQSATYKLDKTMQGMMIDLDDGIIDIQGPLITYNIGTNEETTGRSRILMSPISPYLRINSDKGTTLMFVGNENPETSNYKKNTFAYDPNNYNYWNDSDSGYFLQSNNFSVTKKTSKDPLEFTGTRLDLNTGNLILAGDIIWSNNGENIPVQILYHKGKKIPVYVVYDESKENRKKAFTNKNPQLFVRESENKYVKASGTFNDKTVYYVRAINEKAFIYDTPDKPEYLSEAPGIRPYNGPDKWHSTFIETYTTQDIKDLVRNKDNDSIQVDEGTGTVKPAPDADPYNSDNYYSISYDSGVNWSDPIATNGKINGKNLVASLLNGAEVDGIYHNGSDIGIRAAAIRTGLLYSREGVIDKNLNSFETIRGLVHFTLDLDQGKIDLNDKDASGNVNNFLRIGTGFSGTTATEQLKWDGMRLGNGAIWIKGNGDIVWGGDKEKEDQDWKNQRIQYLFSVGILKYKYTIKEINDEKFILKQIRVLADKYKDSQSKTIEKCYRFPIDKDGKKDEKNAVAITTKNWNNVDKFLDGKSYWYGTSSSLSNATAISTLEFLKKIKNAFYIKASDEKDVIALYTFNEDKNTYSQVTVGVNFSEKVDYYERETKEYNYEAPDAPNTSGKNYTLMPATGIWEKSDDNIEETKRRDIDTTSSGKYPKWHRLCDAKDKYCSVSYDQGASWSAPYEINPKDYKENELSMRAILSTLNTSEEDGIYTYLFNDKSHIGINATAIRVGMLYSREVPSGLTANDNTFDQIRAKAAFTLDLNNGKIDLHSLSKNSDGGYENYLRINTNNDGLRMGNGAITIDNNGNITWGATGNKDWENQKIQYLFSVGLTDYQYHEYAINKTDFDKEKVKTDPKLYYLNSGGIYVRINSSSTYSGGKYYTRTGPVYSKPECPDSDNYKKPTDGNGWKDDEPNSDTSIKNIGNVYPVWHKNCSDKDHYMSISYDQGKKWSEPLEISSTFNYVQMLGVLNNVAQDGIYNYNGKIGILASAIRTGILYSRNFNTSDTTAIATATTFEDLCKVANTVIDMDSGKAYFNNSIQVGSTVAGWKLWHNDKDPKTDDIEYGFSHDSNGIASHYFGQAFSWSYNTNKTKEYAYTVNNHYFAQGSGWTIFIGDGTAKTVNLKTAVSQGAMTHNVLKGSSLTEKYDFTSWDKPTYQVEGNFGVTKDGKLFAKGANISGTVDIENLKIKGNDVEAKDLTIPVAFNVVPKYDYTYTVTENALLGTENVTANQVFGYAIYGELVGAYGYVIAFNNNPQGAIAYQTAINALKNESNYTTPNLESTCPVPVYGTKITQSETQDRIVGYTPKITKTVRVKAWTASGVKIEDAVKTSFDDYGLIQEEGTNNYYPSKDYTLFTTGESNTTIDLTAYYGGDTDWLGYDSSQF